jgi:hypothetical protein
MPGYGPRWHCPGDTPGLRAYPVPVTAIRHLLALRTLAVLICAAALLLKLVVPAGYMIDGDHGRIAITLCPGTAPAPMTTDMPGMAGMHGDRADHGKSQDHGKAEMPCAFSGLSSAVMAALDPIQLAGLVAFVMAIGLVGVVVPVPADPAYLRPPLRGPPAPL